LKQLSKESRKGLRQFTFGLGIATEISRVEMHSWGQGRLSLAAFLQPVIKALTEAQKATGKPILLALRPAPDLDGMKDFLVAQEAFVAAGFPVFHSLYQAAAAMSRIVAWNQA
jgi:hypothetical protein